LEFLDRFQEIISLKHRWRIL